MIAGLSPLLLFSPCLIEIELQLFVIPPVSPAVLVTFTGAAFVLRRKPLCFVSSNTSEKKTPVSFSSSDHFVVIVVNKIQLELLLFMQVPKRKLQMTGEAVICQKLMESTLISLRGAEMQENKVLK